MSTYLKLKKKLNITYLILHFFFRFALGETTKKVFAGATLDLPLFIRMKNLFNGLRRGLRIKK